MSQPAKLSSQQGPPKPALLVWQPEYSIGIEAIDQQHQRLFELMNALHRSVYEKEQGMSVEAALQEMLRYSIHHFSFEEKLLLDSHYPETSEHLRRHTEFRQMLHDLEERFAEGSLVMKSEVLVKLNQWWVSHILTEDKGIGAHLQRQSA